jgi:hypothetical protein
MRIETKIKNYKERLVRKARATGIWENFGQKEVRVLEQMYFNHKYKNDGIWLKIIAFNDWCMNYNG